MYLPVSSKRKPTIFERRFASIIVALGFVMFTWLTLIPPRGFAQMLGSLACLVILFCVGLGTLVQGSPTQALLWPKASARMRPGSPAPHMDERDLFIRYRTFLVSYQILAIVLFCLLVLPGLLLSVHLINLSPLFQTHSLLIVAVLMFLCILLPHCVLPWLEPAITLDPEPDGCADATARGTSQAAAQRSFATWVRLGCNLILWVLIAVTLLWIFHSYTSGR